MSKSTKSNPGIDLPEWAEDLFKPCRYKSLDGGRGGAKSWSVAGALLVLTARQPLRILCARELQNSIKDSVHRLIKDRIESAGLPFTITRDEVRHKNGSLFIFKGLRSNIEEIKSAEGIDIVWVEEAQNVSRTSWEILIPTIRKEGSEIWATWNARYTTDPTYRLFKTNPPDDCLSINVNWDDNPWFPETLRKEKDYAYRTDAEAAEHIWGGKTRTLSKAQVLHGKYIVEAFEPDEQTWNGPYQGIDFGFSQDPSCLVRCWVFGQKLYIEYETYGVGVDNDELPQLFDAIPNARNYISRADSARPETISHLKNHGYRRVVSVKKYSGSVEDGVSHLRSYEQIVIHPRCKKVLEEATLWSWKKDKLTGDILPILVDKHNHLMDALRYALQPMIKRRKTKVSVSKVVKPLVVASRFHV